mmetsp:Transcript_13065/g.33673  ORF Transcript_13065/g.33673 Transcript_13065/m.33673 type:complete len:486 (-) Transcript_13065:192-1649(-)
MGACYSLPRSSAGALLRRTGITYRRVEEVCDVDWKKSLGKGSFGTVYKARMRRASQDTAAVKVLDKRQMRKQRVPQQTVLTEVAMMKLCRGHQRFVQIQDFIDGRYKYFIVMELCEGGNLEEAGHALWEKEPLTEVSVSRLMVQLLEGVQHLHSKDVWHRDIKPQNCMLACVGTSQQLKIADFGIAKRVRAGLLLRDKVGTPAFMAPEQHMLPRSHGYDHKVDIWATGVTMVFLLAHELPFMDARGMLVRQQLINGELPLWSTNAFSGLFQRVSEAMGLSRSAPSESAQDMVKRLLSPSRGERPEATQALQHLWCIQPPTPKAANTQTSPNNGWEDVARIMLSSIQDEVQQFASIVTDRVTQVQSVFTSAVSWDITDPFGPRSTSDKCDVCQTGVALADWKCSACQRWVCAHCMANCERAACPFCTHEDAEAQITRELANASRNIADEDARYPTLLSVGSAPPVQVVPRMSSEPTAVPKPGVAFR